MMLSENCLKRLEAEGMVIVPREPTEAMLRAGMSVRSDSDNLQIPNAYRAYRAMITAYEGE
jgi:hypothetical protein